MDVLKVDDADAQKLTPEEVHQIMMDERDAYPPDSDASDDGYPKLPQDVSVLQGMMMEYETGGWAMDDEPGVQCVFKHQDRKRVQENLTEVLSARKAEALSIIELFSPRRFADLAELFLAW